MSMTTPQPQLRVLILGATGMLGNALFRVLSAESALDVVGYARSASAAALLPAQPRGRVVTGGDILEHSFRDGLFAGVGPDVVVNGIGLNKQLPASKDPIPALTVNALLPHELAKSASRVGARLVHMSTDCVFSGTRGAYHETDAPDATDLYGKSKALGEVDYPHAITLRTSMIGHELDGNRSLVNWFLSSDGPVRGFTNAIFSGLPTVELAAVIRDYVLPNPALCGVYHLSVDPIDKYTLLKLIADRYGKQVEITPDASVVIDRSLDSSRFRQETGFRPKSWDTLVQLMHDFR